MQVAPSPTTLLQNVAGQLAADSRGFLRLSWGSHPRSLPATQELFTAAAQQLEQRGWSRILVNQASMRPFTAAEQQWISKQWLPGAVQVSGYRAGAVVVAANVLTRLATASITTSAPELPLRYRSFDAEAHAISWLLDQRQ